MFTHSSSLFLTLLYSKCTGLFVSLASTSESQGLFFFLRKNGDLRRESDGGFWLSNKEQGEVKFGPGISGSMLLTYPTHVHHQLGMNVERCLANSFYTLHRFKTLPSPQKTDKQIKMAVPLWRFVNITTPSFSIILVYIFAINDSSDVIRTINKCL